MFAKNIYNHGNVYTFKKEILANVFLYVAYLRCISDLVPVYAVRCKTSAIKILEIGQTQWRKYRRWHARHRRELLLRRRARGRGR